MRYRSHNIGNRSALKDLDQDLSVGNLQMICPKCVDYSPPPIYSPLQVPGTQCSLQAKLNLIHRRPRQANRASLATKKGGGRYAQSACTHTPNRAATRSSLHQVPTRRRHTKLTQEYATPHEKLSLVLGARVHLLIPTMVQAVSYKIFGDVHGSGGLQHLTDRVFVSSDQEVFKTSRVGSGSGWVTPPDSTRSDPRGLT